MSNISHFGRLFATRFAVGPTAVLLWDGLINSWPSVPRYRGASIGCCRLHPSYCNFPLHALAKPGACAVPLSLSSTSSRHDEDPAVCNQLLHFPCSWLIVVVHYYVCPSTTVSAALCARQRCRRPFDSAHARAQRASRLVPPFFVLFSVTLVTRLRFFNVTRSTSL